MNLPAFYPILDTETARRHGIAVIDAASEILEAGARILQFRHKGLFSREVFRQAEGVAELCKEAGALFVLNDRADLACLLASALHLGQDDLSPSDARRIIGGTAIVGFSTHNERQLRESVSEPVNYIAFGPIFGTISKLNPDAVVGVDMLSELRALTEHPLVAIGGITRSNALSVIAAGANSVAVIGDLFPANGDLRGRVTEWLQLLPE